MESSDMEMLKGYSCVLWAPGATRRCPFGTLIQAVCQEFAIDKKTTVQYSTSPQIRITAGPVMNLESLLIEKKSVILERWYCVILERYPSDTGRFLKKNKDRFDNPVAYEFRKGMEGIYEALVHGMDRDNISSFLDRIISIRAVQDFPPSGAIAFIFLLKKAIRDTLELEIRKNGISDELTERESRIDGLALLCFDVYMKRREKIYEIKLNEIKNRAGGLLRRACQTSKMEE